MRWVKDLGFSLVLTGVFIFIATYVYGRPVWPKLYCNMAKQRKWDTLWSTTDEQTPRTGRDLSPFLFENSSFPFELKTPNYHLELRTGGHFPISPTF